MKTSDYISLIWIRTIKTISQPTRSQEFVSPFSKTSNAIAPKRTRSEKTYFFKAQAKPNKPSTNNTLMLKIII